MAQVWLINKETGLALQAGQNIGDVCTVQTHNRLTPVQVWDVEYNRLHDTRIVLASGLSGQAVDLDVKATVAKIKPKSLWLILRFGGLA